MRESEWETDIHLWQFSHWPKSNLRQCWNYSKSANCISNWRCFRVCWQRDKRRNVSAEPSEWGIMIKVKAISLSKRAIKFISKKCQGKCHRKQPSWEFSLRSFKCWALTLLLSSFSSSPAVIASISQSALDKIMLDKINMMSFYFPFLWPLSIQKSIILRGMRRSKEQTEV